MLGDPLACATVSVITLSGSPTTFSSSPVTSRVMSFSSSGPSSMCIDSAGAGRSIGGFSGLSDSTATHSGAAETSRSIVSAISRSAGRAARSQSSKITRCGIL